jgi:hypothetical protein
MDASSQAGGHVQDPWYTSQPDGQGEGPELGGRRVGRSVVDEEVGCGGVEAGLLAGADDHSDKEQDDGASPAMPVTLLRRRQGTAAEGGAEAIMDGPFRTPAPAHRNKSRRSATVAGPRPKSREPSRRRGLVHCLARPAARAYASRPESLVGNPPDQAYHFRHDRASPAPGRGYRTYRTDGGRSGYLLAFLIADRPWLACDHHPAGSGAVDGRGAGRAERERTPWLGPSGRSSGVAAGRRCGGP